MYLGGHPSGLPQVLRDAFVDESTSVQAEATDIIEDNFYRRSRTCGCATLRCAGWCAR